MENLIESDLKVKNLDHLGLVAGMIDYLGLVETIDRLIPIDRKVSVGIAVKALILNSMGFGQRALYITPAFFERCPVGLLLGSDYVASDFNDDSLSRCLDLLYEYGLSKLFTQLSHAACLRMGLKREYWHVDSTNFSVEGAYPDEDGAVLLRHGYAKDKRFDLKQVTLGLITTYQSAIPCYMQTFDGNASDKDTLVTMIKEFISRFEQGADVGIMVSDAGVYSANNIAIELKGVDWITRVPETIGEAKELVKCSKDADFQSFTEFLGYKYRAVWSTYGGVKQRWFVIESEPLRAQKKHVVGALYVKQEAAVKAALAKYSKKWVRNPEELAAFIALLQKKNPLVMIQYTLKEQIYYCKAGHPKEENKRIEQQIATFELSPNTKAIEELITEKSRFILATSVLDMQRLSDEQVLTAYKAQATSVENGFKFLKDPLFFAESFFVKKPKRLEALLMIMSLSLLVYSLCEHKLHTALEQGKEEIIDQTGKKKKKPTIRMVFNLFRGIHIVTINQQPKQLCINLNENHKNIIKMLGKDFSKYYFF